MTTKAPTTTDPNPLADGGWRRAAVYGMGLSGRASTRLLRARGVRVDAYDRRPRTAFGAGELGPFEDDPGVALHLGAEPAAAALAADVDGVVLSPGVVPDRPLLAAAHRRGLPVIAEVELAYAAFDPARDALLAITGSNGKSTTTAMTGAVLRAAGRDAVVCGNIGTPLADRVEAPAGAGRRALVVELSSFQLEGIARFRPRAAALLNLSPDHIDRHGDFARYRDAKAAIFRNQGAGDLAVLNADDPQLAALPVPGRRRLFSRRGAVEDGCYLEHGRVLEVAPGRAPAELFTAAELPVAGLHNLENAMAAALLARSQDAPAAAIAAGLRAFQGLPHRMEKVLERAGATYFDDSKATNLGATEASLAGFDDGSVHLILGGLAKGADLGALAPLVARKACRVYLIGDAAPAIAAAFAAASTSTPMPPLVAAGTLARAVAAAGELAGGGQVVLLSPACASFDQFDSFAHRGEVFQRLVAELDHPGAGGRAADGA